MLENVESMYTDMTKMMKRLKKPSYEANMKLFRANFGSYFEEMTSYMENAADKEKTAKEIAKVFVEKVAEAHKKRGKISGSMNIDLNFFTVYYVFPALLLTHHEDAEKICIAICEKWAETFQEGNISYTDYDKLYNAFNTKIFGIF